MGTAKVVIIVIAIIAVIVVIQNGIEKTKALPLESAANTGRSIINAGKDVISAGKDLIEEDEVIPTNTSLGSPPCNEDIDCNTIYECFNNCQCISGECFKI